METNWKTFCQFMKSGTYTKEADIERQLGILLFLSFQWHEGSRLRHQVPVPVGHETKYADIVLYHEKETFVIELKGKGVPIGEAEKGQLKSYMKLLAAEYGMIANDRELRLYYSAFSSNRIEEFATIPYEEANTDGREFAAILPYDQYAKEKLEALRKRKEQEKDEEKLANQLAGILCDEAQGKQMILDALNQCEAVRSVYGAAAIAKALETVEIKRKELIDGDGGTGGTIGPGPHPGGSTFPGFHKKGIPMGSTVVFKGDHRFTAVVCGDKRVGCHCFIFSY